MATNAKGAPAEGALSFEDELALVRFSFESVTAAAYPVAKNPNSMTEAAAILPMVVVECPWGDPHKRETFSRLPLRQLGAVFGKFNQAREALTPEIAGYSFDVRSVSAEDFDEIQAATRRIDPRKAAPLLARYCVGSPTGTHRDSQSWLALPYFTVFLPLMQKLAEDSQRELAAFLEAAVSTS